MSREDTLKAQEQLLITDQFTTMGTLLDGIDCKILLDSCTTKSIMLKQYYLRNKFLQGFSTFSSKAKLIFKMEMEQV